MPTLSNPLLAIDLQSDTPNVRVTGTVTVQFAPQELTLIQLIGLTFQVKTTIMGADKGLNGADDFLFSLPSKSITANTVVSVSKVVNRDALDEDWEGVDEIYAHFTCQSNLISLPMAAQAKSSAEITGRF